MFELSLEDCIILNKTRKELDVSGNYHIYSKLILTRYDILSYETVFIVFSETFCRLKSHLKSIQYIFSNMV